MEDPVSNGTKVVERSGSAGKESHQPPHHHHTLSIEKAHSKEDFNKFFLNKENFSNLCEKCIVGEMKHMKCRWSAWRAFLGAFEIGDESKIRAKVKHDRDSYNKELDHYMNFRTKQKFDIEVDNPLSTNAKNPWNSFFEDNELKSEIRKDVERTYQDIEFFYTKNAQDLLTNILFVWCKQHPDLSYRQGMNEIAGVLTYVCFTENFPAKNPETDIYDFLNDEKEAEADIYVLFKKIMELNQKEMFRSSIPVDPKAKKKAASSEQSRPNLPVVHRAAHIQEDLLPKLDDQLFTHLTKMGVEPQVYMIRWIRCMLSREYRISQTLVIWDALFSYYCKTTPKATTFEFLDFMCVAMLLNISDQLLEKDDGGSILGRLIKYPPIEDETVILNLAHEFIEPLKEGIRGTLKFSTNLRKNPFSKKTNKDDDEDERLKPQPEKKVVLFNPDMPILKNTTKKEEVFPKGPVGKSSDPLDPLSGPFGRGSTATTKKTTSDPPILATNQSNVKKPSNESPFGQGKPITKTVGSNPFAPNKVLMGGDAISSEHLNRMNQKKLEEEKEKKIAEEKERERKAAVQRENEKRLAEEKEKEKERERKAAEEREKEKEKERKAAEEREKEWAKERKIFEEREKEWEKERKAAEEREKEREKERERERKTAEEREKEWENERKAAEERENEREKERERERKAAEEREKEWEKERNATEEREKEREMKEAEEKEKRLEHTKKIEEENEKVIKTLQDALELIKQENEKNNSTPLEEVLAQLNNALDNLKANSDEIKLIK